jgi:hypothetical protein
MNAPWTVREMAGVWHGPAVQDAEGLGVAFVCGAGTDRARADRLAQVIAAAPAMQDALQRIVSHCRRRLPECKEDGWTSMDAEFSLERVIFLATKALGEE